MTRNARLNGNTEVVSTDLRALLFWASVGVRQSVGGQYEDEIEEIISSYSEWLRLPKNKATFRAVNTVLTYLAADVEALVKVLAKAIHDANELISGCNVCCCDDKEMKPHEENCSWAEAQHLLATLGVKG